jgi:indole-3-glycerol phosphate synthase/phosphoribosylanthranilate isomerase
MSKISLIFFTIIFQAIFWGVGAFGVANNILLELVENKKKEVLILKGQLKDQQNHPINRILRGEKVDRPIKSFKRALSEENICIIAEVKRMSPSMPREVSFYDPLLMVEKFVEGGAGAISVLTDSYGFGGSLDDLQKVSKYLKDTKIPVLRKDFIIDPIQLAESVFYGADAVLLIVAVLKEKTRDFIRCAEKMHLDVIVEVINEQELELALEAGAKIVGVNNRNLKTFEVDFHRSSALIQKIPKNIFAISMSGVQFSSDVAYLSRLKFDATLIGGAFTNHKDPALLIQQMREKCSDDRDGKGVKVKICGIKKVEDAIFAARAGADFIGMVFCSRSKRNVSVEQARKIVDAIRDYRSEPVGVFVNQSAEDINSIVCSLGLSYVQLHGEKSKKDHGSIAPHVHKIYAIGVGGGGSVLEKIPSLDPVKDYLLFDNVLPGSGTFFSWMDFSANTDMRWFLAGGLNSSTIERALSFLQPFCLDVSSGVETREAVKSHDLISDFIEKVRTFSEQS